MCICTFPICLCFKKIYDLLKIFYLFAVRVITLSRPANPSAEYRFR